MSSFAANSPAPPHLLLRRTFALVAAVVTANAWFVPPGVAADTKKKAAGPESRWTVRFDRPATAEAFTVTPGADGCEVSTKAGGDTEEAYVSLQLRLDRAIGGLTFNLTTTGSAARMPMALYDAAANELWRHDGKGTPPATVRLGQLHVRGQLVFRVRRPSSSQAASGTIRIAALAFTPSARRDVVAPDGFTVVDTLDELRGYANQPLAKVRLKPGVYTLDRALFRHFIELTGRDSQWDLRGVTLRIDTKLFRQFGGGPGTPGPSYSVFSLTGARVRLEGLNTENIGDLPGAHARSMIFNLTGQGVVLRNVEITTSGSSPWGYGSLFGTSGPDVKAMDGIRIAWPAKEVAVVGCRVHMRSFGHGILVQGAQNTLLQDCQIDGLLRPTNEILAEKAGYAFGRTFTARARNYSEGVYLGPTGAILPDEMIALSEDGIRLQEQAGPDRPTGPTKIIGCTVTRMRRGICTGLSPGADVILNCVVRECVAVGFNVGAGDVVRNSRADAKYAEALSLPSMIADGAEVDLEILDSRGGLANPLLAVVNGTNHHVTLRTTDPAFVPAGLAIEFSSRRGFASGQSGEPAARAITFVNETPAPVLLRNGAAGNDITSRGRVTTAGRGGPANANKVRKQ